MQLCCRPETFRGAAGPLPAGPTPLAPTPPPGPDFDLISTRFRPDFDLKSAFSGPNQVEIGSKSGPGGGVGARGVGPAGRGPVAPRKVSTVGLLSKNRKWGRQTGVRQSSPLSTIGTRYGNSVSTPYASKTNGSQLTLVALYRAMRLRFGYGFESCDANGPQNVKNTNIAKHRPIFLPPLLLVGSKELVLKVPKRWQFHAAIRVIRKRCDSC